MLDEIRKLPGESYVIVTTDHGGGGVHNYRHGSNHPPDMTIFWGCSGPRIPTNFELSESISIIDTSVVVATLLGLPIPATWEGRMPSVLKSAV
jgi:hypothetical protein